MNSCHFLANTLALIVLLAVTSISATCKDDRAHDPYYKNNPNAMTCKQFKAIYGKKWCKKNGWLQKSCAKTCGLCTVTEYDPWDRKFSCGKGYIPVNGWSGIGPQSVYEKAKTAIWKKAQFAEETSSTQQCAGACNTQREFYRKGRKGYTKDCCAYEYVFEMRGMTAVRKCQLHDCTKGGNPEHKGKPSLYRKLPKNSQVAYKFCKKICQKWTLWTDKNAENFCKKIAQAKGKNVSGYFKNGNLVYPFAGDYATKGCYFYKGGHKKYEGLAFYGRGATKAQLEDPGKKEPKFERIPFVFQNCLNSKSSACDQKVTATNDNAAKALCKKIAKAKGLDVNGYKKGSKDYAFAGNYGTKGCYFYKGGHKKYDGLAFYGRGGTWAYMAYQGKDSSKFERIPLYFFESCI